ncbi:MAG: hypothetical protein AAFY83_08045, partial [Pseudomonadota bacterium]
MDHLQHFRPFICCGAQALFASVVAAFYLVCAPARAEQVTWDPAAVRTYLDQVSSSVVGGDIDVHWQEKENQTIWFRHEEPTDAVFYSFDLTTSKKQPVITEQDLRAQLKLLSSDQVSVSKIDLYNDVIELETAEHFYRMRLSSRDLERLGDVNPHQNAKTVRKMFPISGWDRREIKAPNKNTFASLIEDDFAVRSAEDGAVIWRTDDGNEDVRWFFAGDIWESSQTPWSPDSSKLIARRHDMRQVPGVNIIDYLGDTDASEQFRYWARAGEPLPVT